MSVYIKIKEPALLGTISTQQLHTTNGELTHLQPAAPPLPASLVGIATGSPPTPAIPYRISTNTSYSLPQGDAFLHHL